MARPSRASASISRTSCPVAVAPPATQPSGEHKMKEKRAEEEEKEKEEERASVVGAPAPHVGCGLSPRLEMRLALNHDILGDEDLICYEPGPDLTTILGHDLSTFHRLTGRDLLSRSATNRVQPKEAVISYSQQQRNSKMDTPTVNRRPRPALSATSSATAGGTRSRSSSSHGSCSRSRSPSVVGSVRAAVDRQRPHPSPSTWNSSASAARVGGGSGSVAGNSTNCSNNSGGSKLGDLEILARREKIYCMSQLRSGCPVRATSEAATKRTTTTTTTTTSLTTSTTTTTATRRDCSLPTSRAAAAVSQTMGTMSTTSTDAVAATTTTTTATTTTTTTETCHETEAGKSNRLINFIKRRNSEITASSSSNSSNPNNNNSDSTCNEQQQQQQLMLQLHPSQSPIQSQSQSSQLLRQSPDVVDMAQMSPRKDNDKPSLNRRLWKQITKRRRTNSVSQIVAG